MEFIKTESTVSQLPIKERIKWYQEQAKKNGLELSRNRAKALVNEPQGVMWVNDLYTVLVYDGRDADHMVGEPTFKGKITYLSIRRNDRAPAHDWTDFQAIKNFFCGESREAIEIYPAQAGLVDAANQYHLFVMPENWVVPFGMCMQERWDAQGDQGEGDDGGEGVLPSEESGQRVDAG